MFYGINFFLHFHQSELWYIVKSTPMTTTENPEKIYFIRNKKCSFDSLSKNILGKCGENRKSFIFWLFCFFFKNAKFTFSWNDPQMFNFLIYYFQCAIASRYISFDAGIYKRFNENMKRWKINIFEIRWKKKTKISSSLFLMNFGERERRKFEP